MKKNESTFCTIPFTSITTSPNNHWRQCCVSPPLIEKDGKYFSIFEYSIEDMWNHEFYKKLRMDLLNGIKNPVCDKCWQNESVGAFSYRKKANNNDHLIDEKILDKIYANNGYHDIYPKYIVLKLGNLCNLKCIMCNQISSDKIEKEVLFWKSKQEQLPQWLDFIDRFDAPDAVKDVRSLSIKSNPETVIAQLEPALSQCYELELVGGEAFVNPFTNDLLEYCIDQGIAKNISIQTISNLSLINKKQIEFMKQFKSVDITASFDHIDENKFYFIRYPASYIDFRKNFDSLVSDETINLKISATFSIFNIFDIERILDEFETISASLDKSLIINFNLVQEPNYFDIRYLEQEQKNQLSDKILHYLEKNRNHKIFNDNPSLLAYVETLPNYLESRPADFLTVVKERTRVLDLYDKTRNTNHKTLYPFIREY